MHNQHRSLRLRGSLLVGQPLRLPGKVYPLCLDPRTTPARRTQADVVPQNACLLIRDGRSESRAALENPAGVLRAEGRVPVVHLELAPEDGREPVGVGPRPRDDVRRVGVVVGAKLSAHELIHLRVLDDDRLAADGVDGLVFETDEGPRACRAD